MDKFLIIFKKNWLAILLTCFVFLEAGFLVKDSFMNMIRSAPTKPVSEASISSLATQVIETCSKQNYRPGCYDKEIPKLLDRIVMEDAFRVTKVVQDHESGQYEYCHVLGHNLSSKETAKDPSKWKDVITRCPSGMCSNGCIHGAFLERFQKETMNDSEIEKLIPELKTVCEARGNWNPTGLERASCYHAVGHLIMFVTGGDINKSNSVCDRLDHSFLQMCYDGNFMQIFQPLGQEDIDLVKNIAPKTADEADKFCSQYTGLKKNSCHQESWPLSLNQIREPLGLVKFCSYTKNDIEQKRCYNALFYVVSAQMGLDLDKITKFCSALPDSRKGLCFSNSASRMIETDYNLGERAVALCKASKAYGVADDCYRELVVYSTFNYSKGSEGSMYLCSVMPEPWKSKCGYK